MMSNSKIIMIALSLVLSMGASAQEQCLPDRDALRELSKRKQELDKREATLKKTEEDLSAQRTALADEIKKLDEIRKQTEAIEFRLNADQEERLSKLVETLEIMSPKAGSQVLAKIEDDLAVQAMKRLSTTKLSKLMAAMESPRAIKLSELLASRKKERTQSP